MFIYSSETATASSNTGLYVLLSRVNRADVIDVLLYNSATKDSVETIWQQRNVSAALSCITELCSEFPKL